MRRASSLLYCPACPAGECNASNAACSSGKRLAGGGGSSERALSRRAGGEAARSTYSSALSSGAGSQADSATGAGGGAEGGPEVYAWQAGFEAGQEAAAWAKLPSGSFDGDAHDFMTKSPMKVVLLHAEHLASSAKLTHLQLNLVPTRCLHTLNLLNQVVSLWLLFCRA